MPIKNGIVWTPFKEYDGIEKMKVYEDYGADLFRCGPFFADLRLRGYYKGRSSIKFKWVDRRTGTIYFMFLSDFMNEIEEGGHFGMVHNNGKYIGISLTGWFTFVKKGTDYGIKYLGRVEPK